MARLTPAALALTDLILAVFRANAALTSWSDRLVAPLGLTSARWQVLGAIVAAGRPQPVAWLARDLGANRQNLQRIANDLAREGLVSFEPNPHHRRAQLVALTAGGREAFAAAMAAYAPQANSLAKGIDAGDMDLARDLLAQLGRRLEESRR
ncbi:MAG: MarR family winged helix-turn-helix transcriptional regulator [Hyphomicrobiales bacterium]